MSCSTTDCVCGYAVEWLDEDGKTIKNEAQCHHCERWFTYENGKQVELKTQNKEENEIDAFEIVIDFPPMIKNLRDVFNIDERVTVYTYGNKIYNPSNIWLPDHVIEHEKCHMRQQKAYKGGPEQWWRDYIENTDFRVNQEIQAYQSQYLFYCLNNADRNAQARFCMQLAGFLSSGTYKANMSKIEAFKAIQEVLSIYG